MFEVKGLGKELGTGFVRRSAPEPAMRAVVIVLGDPVSDAPLGLVEVLVLVEPHLLFLQAAMKPFDVAIALGMVVSRTPMRDAQSVQSFNVTC